MTMRRLKTVTGLIALVTTGVFVGCQAHDYGVLQPEFVCKECAPGNQTLHYVDQTPRADREPHRHFSVTPNAPPSSQLPDVTQHAPKPSNQKPEDAPTIDLTPPVLTPIPAEEPEKIQPLPPALPSNSRCTPFPRRSPTGDLVPPVALDVRYYSFPGRSPVQEPVESQQRLVPKTSQPKGFFQSLGSGLKKMFSGKRTRNTSVSSSGGSSRYKRYLSRNETVNRSSSQKFLRKNMPISRVTVSRPAPQKVATRVATVKLNEPKALRIQKQNLVLLQVPQTLPGGKETKPERWDSTAQKTETTRPLPAPVVDVPATNPVNTGSNIELWPFRPSAR